MSWRSNLLILSSCLCLAAPVAALTVDLSAEASVAAPNDLVRATVAADVAGATPAQLAAKANSAIAEGLRIAKAYPAVKARTGGVHSFPVYGKNGQIESWRMRSELLLESRDAATMGELLGKLQANLLMAGLSAAPAPETRSKAEERAILDAIATFHARAKVVAGTFGKPYRIKSLSVSTQGGPVMPMFKAQRMALAEAAPAPVEAGESQVTAVVSGQIEITD
ncbi:MAG: SIMPL domain-containing protein [Betaproteobacteria bacterium]